MSFKELIDSQLNNIQQHVESAVVSHNEYFQQVLTKEQYDYFLNKIVGDKYILSILMSSSVASIIAGIFYLLGSGSSDSRKNIDSKKPKKKKKKNNNNKKSKKEPITGEILKKNSGLEIENILKLVQEEILPRIEEYEQSLSKFNKEKMDAIAGKDMNNKKKNKKKNAKSTMTDLEYDHEKVKESINYLYLYIEEYLLKKLMKLDDLDLFGDAELRAKRKSAIKYIQGLHKKIDELKTQYYIGSHISDDDDSVSTSSIVEEDETKNK